MTFRDMNFMQYYYGQQNDVLSIVGSWKDQLWMLSVLFNLFPAAESSWNVVILCWQIWRAMWEVKPDGSTGGSDQFIADFAKCLACCNTETNVNIFIELQTVYCTCVLRVLHIYSSHRSNTIWTCIHTSKHIPKLL